MPKSSQKNVNPKIPLIIDCTLEILRDQGDQGLSMRQVATKAGMSLGNLQYYFRNKDELLLGLADLYFKRCSTDFSDSLVAHSPNSKREYIEFFVGYGLDYANSETGKVFRELWGISTRNERIRERLHEYSRLYVDSLDEVFSPFAINADSIAKVATLLIPFFDGYGLISYPLPADRQEATRLLVDIIDLVLAGEL